MSLRPTALAGCDRRTDHATSTSIAIAGIANVVSGKGETISNNDRNASNYLYYIRRKVKLGYIIVRSKA